MIARCRCGAEWQQHGNQSGHCATCHTTFSSNVAFDLHRRLVDGRPVCIPPAELRNRKGELVLEGRVDKIGTTQWGQRGSRPKELA